MPALDLQNDPDLAEYDTVSDLASIITQSTAALGAHNGYFSTATSSTLSTFPAKRRTSVRKSIFGLHRLSRELSSFIHSHSNSSFTTQSQPRVSLADDSMNDIQLRPSLDMKLPCSHAEDERPSRRTKLESRIYNFLTRSRSRSRSHLDIDDTNKSSSKSRERMRRESTDQRPKPAPTTKMPNGTKPASRIPSRPLSSNTSTTNSTVTPSTPKANRRPPSGLPTPTQMRSLPKPDSNIPPRPTTPKQSATTKKKISNLFNIPLALRRSSRSRSRSRPNSPQPSLRDAPPLPSSGYDNDPTPKPRKTSNSPHTSRPSTPTPKPKPRPSDPPSRSNSLKLPKIFSGRPSTTISGANALQPRTSNGTATTTTTPPKPSSGATSSSAEAPKRPAAYARRSLEPAFPHPYAAQPSRIATASTRRPAISQTPPSALKGSVSVPAENKAPAVSRVRESHQHHVAKNASMDASYRYRGGNMSIVSEESRNSADVSLKGKAKEGSSEVYSHLRQPSAVKMSAALRSTKHGSFDFERPGWGATIMQRTGSNGTAVTATSIQSKESHPAERESAIGAGLAGVGTLQRDKSLKRAKNNEEEMKARERAKRLQEYVQKDKMPPVAVVNGNGSASNHSDHLNASTSTNGTVQTNKTSSLGKAAGKRVLAGSRAGGSGSGVGRFIGTAHHGLFSFEPPVPSPTRSTGSNGTLGDNGQSTGGRSDRSAASQLLMDEKGKGREGEKKQASKGDRPPVPVPAPTSYLQRPGHRGRSLDLGIGLSWAPSKMKETALLPSTTLFNRTASNSSSLGRSASGSTVGRSASSSTNGNDSSRSRKFHIHDSDTEAERSKLGKEVAELFRSVLDDRSYNLFKTYVKQFDAHEIPFDGPLGIVERVERLLRNARDGGQDNRVLLDKFIRIILQNA